MAKYEIINDTWIKQLECYEPIPMPATGPFIHSYETIPFTNNQYVAIKISDINYIQNLLSGGKKSTLHGQPIKMSYNYYATINLMTEKHSIVIFYFNDEKDLYLKDLALFEKIIFKK